MYPNVKKNVVDANVIMLDTVTPGPSDAGLNSYSKG
jgi:hypothetical protein